VRRLAIALVVVAWFAASAAAEKISKIVVEENTKTTDDTVIFISELEEGDTWNADKVDEIKKRLVSSGLFKDVDVYWAADPKNPGKVIVHIIAKDKHSWVIAPAFYNQPTNVGGGVGFGENNLFGQNQKLLLYAQIATGDSFFIGAWQIPSIGGTHLYAQFDTYLKYARNIEYNSPRDLLIKDEIHGVRQSRMLYLNGGFRLGWEFMEGVKLDTRIRGAKVSYRDVKWLDTAQPGDVPAGTVIDTTMDAPAPDAEGWDISNETDLTFDTRANWYGVQSGHRYRLTYEQGLPSLGSDFDYWVGTLNIFKAVKILDRHNFIAKLDIAYGRRLPFQQELKTGGTSMRGYINDEFRGNFRTLANLEYSVPVFTIMGFGVRALAFWDSAYTTFTKTSDNPTRDYLANPQVRGFDGFKNSVGVGTRFYLRQIVLPLLGLDFGYGLEARDYQIYLAIGLTD
jgi:outer membrane protein assembly factor BamA